MLAGSTTCVVNPHQVICIVNGLLMLMPLQSMSFTQLAQLIFVCFAKPSVTCVYIICLNHLYL